MILPGLSAQSHAKQAMVGAMHATPFVWSVMGQDVGQPLNEIIIRKEAERRTGGNFWWGLGTPLGERVESVAILNQGTLPALFSALGNQNQASNQSIYVWNGWRSVRKGRHGTYNHGSIPEHALVLGGNPERPYYALVCRCDSELVLGDHGPFDPARPIPHCIQRTLGRTVVCAAYEASDVNCGGISQSSPVQAGRRLAWPSQEPPRLKLYAASMATAQHGRQIVETR
jgi:hypothetical protein